MNDESTRTSVVLHSELDNWDDSCELHSHASCDPQVCKVRRLTEDLSNAQIQVAIDTARRGLDVSAIYALAVLTVWVFHAVQGHAMPPIPWIVTSIAMATFTAGGICALKIPKKAPLKLEDKE